MVAFGADGFHLDCFTRRLRRGDDRLGREIEGNAEDVGIFGVEEILLVEVVGLAPQSAANDLLAEKLGAEGADTQDVGDVVGVPPLGEHGNRHDAADAGTELVELADRVHDLSQQLLVGQVFGGAGIAGALDDLAAEALDLVHGHGAEVGIEGIA